MKDDIEFYKKMIFCFSGFLFANVLMIVSLLFRISELDFSLSTLRFFIFLVVMSMLVNISAIISYKLSIKECLNDEKMPV